MKIEALKKYKKPFFTFLKIGISVLFIYLVYTQVPFKKVWKVYQSADAFFLIGAIALFMLSQWVSAKRLMLYFKKLNFDLKDKENQRLYLVGMFYNFFIPGGVGGDAFKVYFLHKNYKWSTKKLGKAIFFDRLIGLGAIVILIVLLLSMLPMLPILAKISLPLLAVFGIIIGFVVFRVIAKEFASVFWKAIGLSFIVQLLQISCIALILNALGVFKYYLEYGLSFLISTIAGVLSIGGLGIREFIFWKLSDYLPVNENTSVAIGLMFSMITAMVSLLGAYYHLFEKKYFGSTE